MYSLKRIRAKTCLYYGTTIGKQVGGFYCGHGGTVNKRSLKSYRES